MMINVILSHTTQKSELLKGSLNNDEVIYQVRTF